MYLTINRKDRKKKSKEKTKTAHKRTVPVRYRYQVSCYDEKVWRQMPYHSVGFKIIILKFSSYNFLKKKKVAAKKITKWNGLLNFWYIILEIYLTTVPYCTGSSNLVNDLISFIIHDHEWVCLQWQKIRKSLNDDDDVKVD